MRDGDPLRLVSLALSTFFWFAPLTLTFFDSASAQTSVRPDVSTSVPPATLAPSAQSLKDWQALIVRVPAPSKGCFTASYPSTEWHEVPCGPPPTRRYPPARGPRPATVGKGNGYGDAR